MHALTELEAKNMQGSTPQTFTIAEFLKWNDDKELELNPKFQRGPVWTAQARTYLIDSILRGYPIPKLLLRTTIDRDSRRTVRDVVDGQQRLRTIIDFSSGKLVLGAKAKDLKGSRYDDLPDAMKDSFLGYKLTCEQLLNASDDDVLEVFIRINSYAVPVTEAELRNARFDSVFSDLVKNVVSEVGPVWTLGVISPRERVRMVDQSLVAESFSFFERGVIDGAEPDVTRYYVSTKSRELKELTDPAMVRDSLLETAGYLKELLGEPLVQRAHFLMLLAAILYAHDLLPAGKLNFEDIPDRALMLQDRDAVVSSLSALNQALSTDDDGADRFLSFRTARSSTARMKSRQPRFEYFCRALVGEFAE